MFVVFRVPFRSIVIHDVFVFMIFKFLHDPVLSWLLKGTHGWFMQTQDSRLLVNTRRRSTWSTSSSWFTGMIADMHLLISLYGIWDPSCVVLNWIDSKMLAGSQEHRLCPVQGSILVRLSGGSYSEAVFGIVSQLFQHHQHRSTWCVKDRFAQHHWSVEEGTKNSSTFFVGQSCSSGPSKSWTFRLSISSSLVHLFLLTRWRYEPGTLESWCGRSSEAIAIKRRNPPGCFLPNDFS